MPKKISKPVVPIQTIEDRIFIRLRRRPRVLPGEECGSFCFGEPPVASLAFGGMSPPLGRGGCLSEVR